MKKISFALLGLSALFLSACGATVKVKSTVATKELRPDIKSIFILAQGVEKTDELISYMGVHMDSVLVSEGFRTMVHIEKPLSLDNGADYKQKITAFKPDAALFVVFKEGTTQSGSLIKAVFDAVLVDSTLNKKVWRATVTMDLIGWNSTMWKPHGKLLGNEIRRQMDEDSVIHLRNKISEPFSGSRNPSEAN